MNEKSNLLHGEVLEEDVEVSMSELCRACNLSVARVVKLVDEGVIEPRGREPAVWRFRSVSIQRIRRVRRLERDLGVNTAGAALALDLLDEIERLRSRLRALSG
jgi:chaperone modulatory protein CbpM